MLPEQVKRLRKIQLYSRIKLRNVFPGEWESVFKGEGIDFAAIQPFEPGDDLRELNLQTLVQSGEEEIIQRVLGRQRRMFIWADWSGSMRKSKEMFFSSKPVIREIGIGLLVYAAWNSYCPVGLCAFDYAIRKFFPARSGERFCQEMMTWIANEEPEATAGSADISNAISFMLEKVPPHSFVFFVSDFQDQAFLGDFTDQLRPVACRFDFIPVVVRDPLEKAVRINRPLTIALTDGEGDGEAEIYLTPRILNDMQVISARHLVHLEQSFRQAGVQHMVLDAPSVEDCGRVLSSFFEERKRTGR